MHTHLSRYFMTVMQLVISIVEVKKSASYQILQRTNLAKVSDIKLFKNEKKEQKKKYLIQIKNLSNQNHKFHNFHNLLTLQMIRKITFVCFFGSLCDHEITRDFSHFKKSIC